MKTSAIALISLMTFAFSFSSCSRCYKCKHDVVYYVNGVPDTTKGVEEDYCTASNKDLQEKEDAGYTCVAN